MAALFIAKNWCWPSWHWQSPCPITATGSWGSRRSRCGCFPVMAERRPSCYWAAAMWRSDMTRVDFRSHEHARHQRRPACQCRSEIYHRRLLSTVAYGRHPGLLTGVRAFLSARWLMGGAHGRPGLSLRHGNGRQPELETMVRPAQQHAEASAQQNWEYTFLNALPMAKRPRLLVCPSRVRADTGDVTAHWNSTTAFLRTLTTRMWNWENGTPISSAISSVRWETSGQRHQNHRLPAHIGADGLPQQRLDIRFTDSMLRTTPFPVYRSHGPWSIPTVLYDTNIISAGQGSSRHSRGLTENPVIIDFKEDERPSPQNHFSGNKNKLLVTATRRRKLS